MPTYRHPRAGDDSTGPPPARVHVTRADKRPVDVDGVFEAPRHVAEAIAAHHGTTEEAMRVSDAESGASGGASDETTDGSDDDEDGEDAASVDEEANADDDGPLEDDSDGGECQHVLTSGDREGEVCGRDLPCSYHSEGD